MTPSPKQSACIISACLWSNPREAVFFTGSSELHFPRPIILDWQDRMCYKLLVLGINLEKVTNNNNDESAAEMALEKYINKRENSTDFALFSDTFCSRGACFIFYGYTTVIFFPWYQSTTHINITDWCLKTHTGVRSHARLQLISSNSQQDIEWLTARIPDLRGLVRLPRIVDDKMQKKATREEEEEEEQYSHTSQ